MRRRSTCTAHRGATLSAASRTLTELNLRPRVARRSRSGSRRLSPRRCGLLEARAARPGAWSRRTRVRAGHPSGLRRATEEAIAAADQALALAGPARPAPTPANALGFRGFARGQLGEQDGAGGDAAGAPGWRSSRARATRPSAASVTTSPSSGVAVRGAAARRSAWIAEGIAFCRRRGLRRSGRQTMAGGRTPLPGRDSARAEQALAEAGATRRPPRGRRRRRVRRAAHAAAAPAHRTGAARSRAQLGADARGRPRHRRTTVGCGRGRRSRPPPTPGETPNGRASSSGSSTAPPAAATLSTPRSCPASSAPHWPLTTRASPPALRTASQTSSPSSSTPSRQAGHQLAEAAGDHREAVPLYADAAGRWHQFGNVPERAYALLGEGRCLSAIGDPTAEQPLVAARELFAAMGYQPALAETEALLRQAQAAAT